MSDARRRRREAEKHLERAARLHGAGRPAEALAGFDAALAAAPGLAAALSGRGAALVSLGALREAIAAFDGAIAADPGQVEALTNRGIAKAMIGDIAGAAASYEAALTADPLSLPAAINLGVLQLGIGAPDAALPPLVHACEIAPGYALAQHFAGVALTRLQRIPEAIAALRRAVALDPGLVDAWLMLGFVLTQRSATAEAIAAYGKALALDANRHDAQTLRLHNKRCLADWQGYDQTLDWIAAGLPAAGGAAPFHLLSTVDDPELQRRAAERHLAHQQLPGLRPGLPAAHPRGERLRIAYVSADFQDHATMYLLAGVLEAHDRARFEITAVSLGPDVDDSYRRRTLAAVDSFLPLADWAEADIAVELRRRAIDVAIDLKGYTSQAKLGIFTARAAPVQASFLGYPGTLGMAAMDYLIADHHVVPAAERAHYAERLIWLPHCYQPNDRGRAVGTAPTRAEAGLPEDAMVFASFNQIAKLTPSVFAAWMSILGQVPGSVLWLWADGAVPRANLAAAAAAAGIAPDRLVFADGVAIAAHLARLPLADLMLDSLPYNAHTTASDALGQGLPLVTCTGRAFASRVATSLLHAVGLPELACSSLDDYITLAVALGRDRVRLAALRTRLVANLPAAPLFDTVGFTRRLEAAFFAMDARARAGLAPADIDLAAV